MLTVCIQEICNPCKSTHNAVYVVKRIIYNKSNICVKCDKQGLHKKP